VRVYDWGQCCFRPLTQFYSFLRAKLIADFLSNQVAPQVFNAAIHQLRNIPPADEGLNDLYASIMRSFMLQEDQSQSLALETLTWLSQARRPLTCGELQHALTAGVKIEPADLPNVNVLHSICSGLVTVEKHSGIMRLVHCTANQYLKNTASVWFPDAEKKLALRCLAYLSYEDFSSGYCQSDDEFEARLGSHVLYEYAARYWGYHARTVSMEIEMTILKFLQDEGKVSSCSQVLLTGERFLYRGYSQDVPRNVTGIHLAAYFGLSEVLITMLKKGYGADVQDSYGRTPIWYASATGHGKALETLIHKPGIDPDLPDKNGHTPLSEAAKKGYTHIVDILLGMGAHTESQDKAERTPLSWAAEMGHKDIVEKLLSVNKSHSDGQDADGRTPLSWAAEKGWKEIVEFLLVQEGVNPDREDKCARTPLSRAAENGCVEIVKIFLVQESIYADSQDKDGRTPMSWAAEKGQIQIVRRLLAEKSVHPNSSDKHGRTPLLWAVKQGHIETVNILLENSIIRASQSSPATEADGHECSVKQESLQGTVFPERRNPPLANVKFEGQQTVEAQQPSPNINDSGLSPNIEPLLWEPSAESDYNNDQDFQVQHMLLEQQEKRRLMRTPCAL
jgi:ankyrin repeat protein